MRRVAVSPLALFFGIILLGCDPPKPAASNPAAPPLPPPPPGSAPVAPPPPAPAVPAATSPAPLPPEAKFGAFAGGIDDLAARPSTPPASPPSAAAEQPTERIKAEKGVGIKGRSLDQYEGIVVTPAKAYFSIRERIVFEDQIPHALNLHKASEGQGPKSHAEFMEKIIQFNRIKLPQLPPDAKYVYDVENEQLMVERPKKQ